MTKVLSNSIKTTGFRKDKNIIRGLSQKKRSKINHLDDEQMGSIINDHHGANRVLPLYIKSVLI